MIFFILGHLLYTVPSQVHRDFSSSKASNPTFCRFYQYYIKMHLQFSDQLDQRHFRKRFIPWKAFDSTPQRVNLHKFTNYCQLTHLAAIQLHESLRDSREIDSQGMYQLYR